MDTKYSVKQKMLVFQAFSAIIAFGMSVLLVPFVLLSGYYAKKHMKEATFIFMPRPELPETVKFTEFFRDNTEYQNYLKELDDLPNMKVVIDEPYIDIFSTSDAMITDSVTLMGEYIYTLKPVLFLVGKSQVHNELGEQLIDTQFSCPANDYAVIEKMISDVILSGNNAKIEDRIELFADVFDYVGYNETMATDYIFNVIESLVNGF